MREHLTAKRAWVAIGLGVSAYELLAPDNQLLSEGVDRALEHSPLAKVATLAAIGVTALHLSNVFEKLGIESFDPFHQFHRGVKVIYSSLEK